MVDAGKVDQEKLVQEILQCSKPKEIPSRALSAVFLRKEIAQDIHRLLCQKTGSTPDSQITNDPEFPHVYFGEPETSKTTFSFSDALERTWNTGIPAIVTCTSLDQALDTIEKLEGKVAQIAIVSPASTKHAEYMKSWVSAPIIVIGSIRSLFPTGTPLNMNRLRLA